MTPPQEIAWQSVQVLLSALWKAVALDGKSTTSGTPMDPLLDGPCPIDSAGQTQFFLAAAATTTADASDGTATTETNLLCRRADMYVLLYLTIAVHVISWGLRWCLWEPAVRILFRYYGQSKSKDNDGTVSLNRDMQRKISMNLTATFFFTASAITAFQLFVHEPWLYQPATWLHDRQAALQQVATSARYVTAAIKCYYFLYMARFLSDTASLAFEVGRTTTTLCVALLHHAVTLGLVLIAVYGHYIRGAAVIMFFFDWADPPLLLAKVCKYLSEALPNNNNKSTLLTWCANRLFELFAVTFFISRNGIYNFVTYTFWCTLPAEAVLERITLALLAALQTYWAVLIVQAALRREASADGAIQDVRETAQTQKKEA